eukprot:m.195852 g.195852  ORF g.195852 m.195852 type:complete len:234 (-) comp16811_c4_seq4:1539-2240(-)
MTEQPNLVARLFARIRVRRRPHVLKQHKQQQKNDSSRNAGVQGKGQGNTTKFNMSLFESTDHCTSLNTASYNNTTTDTRTRAQHRGNRTKPYVSNGSGALTKAAVLDVLKQSSSNSEMKQSRPAHLQQRHASDGVLQRLPNNTEAVQGERRLSHANLLPLKQEYLDQFAFQPFSLSEKLTRWCHCTDFMNPRAPPPHTNTSAIDHRHSMYSGTSLMDWQTFAIRRAYRRKTRV